MQKLHWLLMFLKQVNIPCINDLNTKIKKKVYGVLKIFLKSEKNYFIMLYRHTYFQVRKSRLLYYVSEISEIDNAFFVLPSHSTK